MVKLVRYSPVRQVSPLSRAMDEMWRNAAPADNGLTLRPAMDVIENESGYEVRINLPGLSPDQVDIQVEDNVLTISGEIAHSEAQDGERYHHRERRYGAFKRSLRLPAEIDVEQAAAAFDNGVLSLALPKLPEAQPRRIPVTTA